MSALDARVAEPRPQIREAEAKPPPPHFNRYAAAVLSVVAAACVRTALHPVLGSKIAYGIFLLAAILVGFYCGPGPSLLSLILGLIVGSMLFLGEAGIAENAAAVVMYLLIGTAAALLTEILRRARVRAEQTASQLQMTLNSIGDAVIVVDAAGNITLLNPIAEKLTGWKLREAEGLPLRDVFQIVHETTREPMEDPTVRVLREGITQAIANATALIGKNGGERLIEDCASPIRSRDSRVRGAILVFRDVTESRRAENALRESEERFRRMADTAPVMIWTSGRDKRSDWFNRPWLDFVGKSLDEEVGEGWKRNVHPDDLDKHNETYVTSFDARASFQVEYRLRHAGSQYRRILNHGVPRYSSDGEFLGYIGSCIDIEDREQAEAVRARLAAIVENSNDAVISKDLEGRILTWNESAQRIFGYTEAEVVGKHITILIPSNLQSEETEILARLRRGERISHYETVRKTKSGREISVSLTSSPIKDEKGRIIAASKIVRDITEKKEAEARLVEEKERLRTTLTSIGDAVIATDSSGRITIFNQVAEALTGWSQKECLGKALEEVFLTINEETRAPEQNLVSGVLQQGSVQNLKRPSILVTRNGAEMPIESIAAPILDSWGMRGVVLVFSDVTLRRKSEQEILELNRRLRDADRRKDEFLAMLAHELRNPLAPIVSAVRLLQLKGSSDPVLVQAREVIDRQAKHTVRLVDDLLEASRINAGKISLSRSKVDLCSTLIATVEAVRDLAESKHLELSLSLPKTAMNVHADATRITQVIGNLLNNAISYTPDHGEIWVSADKVDSRIVLRVKDSGVGIPRDMLSSIFELFTQVDQSLARTNGGLGVGLTIARRLVEMHGGTIEALSEGLGSGSEFVVNLPAYAGEDEATSAMNTFEAKKRASARVLIVDDNIDGAETLALLLRHYGHDVRVAHDGNVVLEAVRAFRPQVVLLDIGLPGMHGFDVARLLRKEYGRERLTIVALTGYGREMDHLRSEEAGIDHHLVKPVEPDLVLKVIDDVKTIAEPAV